MKTSIDTKILRPLARIFVASLLMGSLISRNADAQDNSSQKAQKRMPAASKAPTVKNRTPAAAPKTTPPGDGEGDDYVVGSSTKIDFSETTIDGKMKAPDGFFLQGHNSNSLSQMVKLRSSFRSELRNSRSAVKSHVK
jgi:hypothetical protein